MGFAAQLIRRDETLRRCGRRTEFVAPAAKRKVLYDDVLEFLPGPADGPFGFEVLL